MVNWEARVPWPGPGVGCFDPALVFHKMQDVFGSDLEYDGTDLLSGHYERIVNSAAELGIRPDSSVVISAARLVREVSPRYSFRLRVGNDMYVAGQVDRYRIGVICKNEADFAEPMKSRFIDFLRSLKLGEVHVEIPSDGGEVK